jgi:hypothetical protein
VGAGRRKQTGLRVVRRDGLGAPTFPQRRRLGMERKRINCVFSIPPSGVVRVRPGGTTLPYVL